MNGTLLRAALAGLLLLVPLVLRAEVGDPTLQTDHEFYPGEGAFQTIEQCVAYATAGRETPQDKAIGLYLWLLTHQFHLYSPQEWNVPGCRPGERRDDYEMVVYDANRGRFSYGYGLCGTVHAWNEPYWRALGMNVRRRAFPGHVNSEVFYDGAWHAFDTDMAGLVFRRDGVVAGYDDIVRDPALIDVDRPPLPRYPFAWPSDFNAMKQGWQQVAKGGNWYKMYHSGYAALPGIVHLRSGETFTRYFDPDHFGGPSKRRFWHIQPGGPRRNWTFVNAGTPRHEGAQSNSRGNASYCNAEFVYRPPLGDGRFREGVVDELNLATAPKSPQLRSADSKPASVTFQHFSPYVICGDPEDDANPMTGRASGGLVVKGKAVGDVSLFVRPIDKREWVDAGRVAGSFEIDLTENAKGHYGWQIRLQWEGTAGIDQLEFTTVCQVAQPMYPRLRAGGSDVVYRAASRAVTVVPLDWSSPSEEDSSLAKSSNVVYRQRTAKQRLAYAVQGNKPGKIVLPAIESQRGPLLAISAAARFSVRSPSPPDCDFRLEYSTAWPDGAAWQPLAHAEMPDDNEYSSGWMYGRADLPEQGADRAVVRAHLYAGGYSTGLITAELYGVYRTPPPQAVRVTYAWREGRQHKEHVEQVPAGSAEHRFRVPTGEQIVDDFVRIEAP